MSSKWKNALLSAEERVERIKNGDKEVFDEEVERTKEVVNSRRELGLDTTEQENWLDTVAYNYNLGNAEKMGISPDKVSKTGYADIYLNGKKSGSGKHTSAKEYRTTSGLTSTPISDAQYKIEMAKKLAKQEIEKQYADKKEKIKSEYSNGNSNIREMILNRGGHDDGGKMAKVNRELESTLEDILAKTDAEMQEKLLYIDKKYAGLINELLDYRKNGATLSSLGAIADGLIRNAAIEDGFDLSGIPGFGKIKVTSVKTSDKKENSEESEQEIKKLLTKLSSENKTSEDKDAEEMDNNFAAGELLGQPDDEKEVSLESDEGDDIASKKNDQSENIDNNNLLNKALDIIANHAKLNKKNARAILELIKDSLSI